MSDNFSIDNNNSVGGLPQRKIRIGDENSPVEINPSNIFNIENPLDEPFTEFLKKFDENNNGKLDNNEPLIAEIAFRQAAGIDYILDDEEFLNFIDEPNYSFYAEKMKASMLQYIEEVREDVEIHTYDGVTEYIHSDGSALTIEENDDSRTFTIYNKDGVEIEGILFEGKYKKQDEEEPNYHVVRFKKYDNNENDMPIMTAIAYDDESLSDFKYSRTDFSYYLNGNKKEIQAQTIYNSGIKETIHTKYGKNGKDKEYYKKETEYGAKKESVEIIYAQQGFPVKQSQITNDGETIEEKIYEWNNLTGIIEKTGHIISDASNPDIKIISNQKNYKEGVAEKAHTKTEQYTLEESYSGANIEERDESIPNEIILKNSSGKVIKITKNDINENGVLVGQTIEDKIKGTTTHYDFSALNGKYEVFYQGDVGNCFKLQSINAFNLTEAGRKVLDNLVSKSETTDEDGTTHTIYHVKYPALPEVKKYLIDNFGIKEEDLMFPSDNTYSVTDEEIEIASSPEYAGNSLSYGDKDALPLELAYIKFRLSSADTIKKADLQDKYKENEVGFITGFDGHKINISHGGQPAVTMYLMSGKKSNVYFINSDNVPVCIRDKTSDVIKLDINERLKLESDSTDQGADCINKIYNDFEEFMDILKKDTDENGIFKSTAAYVGLAISDYSAGGKAYRPGLHAFSIKGIKDNNVLLIDPDDPTRDLTMSIDDLRLAAFQMGGLYLGEE